MSSVLFLSFSIEANFPTESSFQIHQSVHTKPRNILTATFKLKVVNYMTAVPIKLPSQLHNSGKLPKWSSHENSKAAQCTKVLNIHPY